MMEDELIKIWQSSSEAAQIKFEKSRLMIDLQSGLNRLQRSWNNMQLREIIAALLVVPFFIYKAFVAEQQLVKIGAIWIVLSAVYIIYRLLKTKKHKPNAITENYLDYLYKSKEYLSIQKKLLDTVIYWYFAPIAIGILLIFVGTLKVGLRLFLNILGLVALGVGIYVLNRWSAKKNITPRLDKIDELIKVMEE